MAAERGSWEPGRLPDGPPVICAWCEEAQVPAGRRRYCSAECARSRRCEEAELRMAALRAARGEEARCAVCGAPWLGWKRRRYCGPECAAVALREQLLVGGRAYRRRRRARALPVGG